MKFTENLEIIVRISRYTSEDIDYIYKYVFQAYGHYMGYFKKKFNISDADAEEIVSNSLIKFYKRIGSIEISEEAGLKSYLFAIINSETIDFIRKKNRQKSFSLCDFDSIQHENSTFLDDEEKAAIHNAVNKLPELYCEIIKLRFFKAFSYEDIAKALDISTDNAYNRVHRAINKLKEILK